VTAGLPALGLNGLFVILCALVIPLRRRADGRPRRTRFLVALAIAVSIATVALWQLGLSAATRGPTVSLGVPAILITLGVLGGILLVPELQYRLQGVRPTATPPAIPRAPVIARAAVPQRFPLPESRNPA
jgi:hypothetical protein